MPDFCDRCGPRPKEAPLVLCAPCALTLAGCEYFTRYGNDAQPGECREISTMQLIGGPVPPIRVCLLHARVIIGRFPNLGGLERFRRLV